MSLLSRIFKAEPGSENKADPAAASFGGPAGTFTPAEPGDFHARWLEATGAAGVVLKAVPGEPGLLASKLGGQPYLPPGAAWPVGSGGGPLFHLAQLNFEQLPPLAGFPESGLLQFFIAGGATHGMHLEDLTSGAGHVVLYHPAPPAGGEAAGPHPDGPDVAGMIRDFDLPFEAVRAVALAGRPVTVPISYTDHRFGARGRDLMGGPGGAWAGLAVAAGPGGLGQPFKDGFDQVFGRGGHLVGGNPFFVGDDPRSMEAYASFTTLLLQIDSDAAAALNWGEGGLCNFFIEPDRLAAGDFSRVLYHWDCH